MIYKGPQLSTFWGDAPYENRMAHVMKNEHGYYIEMYDKDTLVETRPLYNHSEVYAENAAENFVMGILNP